MLCDRKYKLPNQQNGQVYLTSHRVCYVDKESPRKYSVALDLKDVERFELYVSHIALDAALNVLLTIDRLDSSSHHLR